MNKEQIIDKVYERYSITAGMSTQVLTLTKDSFIQMIKIDSKFSKKWGLKIEERELRYEERLELWYQKNQSETGKRGIWEIDYIEKYEGHKKLNSYNIPTKLITLTYNNKTIESYE